MIDKLCQQGISETIYNGNLVALRVSVGFGLLELGWWSCYQDASGLVVRGVGETMCGSS